MHFLYSDYGCSITNNINKMLNKLMITLTLFVGPVEPIIQYLKSKPNSNDTNVTDDNNDISFLQQNDFDNIFDIENISMDQRFQNRRNSNPIQLVQTIFSKGKKNCQRCTGCRKGIGLLQVYFGLFRVERAIL